MIRARVLLAAALAGAVPAAAGEIHFSPAERLDEIDAREIDAARERVDLAGFVLSDHVVISALTRAAERGVIVRIVVDGRQHSDWRRLVPLADGVRVRPGGPYQHLKAYGVDGATYRSGSANFSFSGENQQSNELTISSDPPDAARFEGVFAEIWRAAIPMADYGPAVSASEPE